MTRFKKFIKDYRFKGFSLMDLDFVDSVLWAVLIVASWLVAVVGIIIVNVVGFTNASNGGLLLATIVLDAALLLIVAICIYTLPPEGHRKKHSLPRHTESEFLGFHQ